MERRKPRKPKKFRSQILAQWIKETYEPCKVADIGGGKGLLSYILNQSRFDCTVIDPEYQELPRKYTNLEKKKVVINHDEKVKRITQKFSPELAKNFDLLIGLHTHGSCIYILNAAEKYKKDFVLLPCCVIDEPIEKTPNINWRESLIKIAQEKKLNAKTHKLNFMGKDIAIYTTNFLVKQNDSG